MRTLAIETSWGKSEERQGREAVTNMLKLQGYDFIATHPERPALVDGFICRNGILLSVVEIKTRHDMTVETLFDQRGGEWLITASKIDRLVDIATKLYVSAYGFLYLPNSGIILSKKICNPQGEIVTELKPDNRITKQPLTGQRERWNNYLVPMQNAQQFTYK